jgi:predicted regulator of Ras-like GTPase activity (Roadblock/LC7/MglB family)
MADGPFREQIKRLVERLEGGVAAVMMGFDGITLDSYVQPREAAATAQHGAGALPDILTMAMEFAHLIAQARRTLQSLDAGALEEFTLRTDVLTLIVRVLTPEYFLACAVRPAANLGKARYLMRLTAPGLRADL